MINKKIVAAIFLVIEVHIGITSSLTYLIVKAVLGLENEKEEHAQTLVVEGHGAREEDEGDDSHGPHVHLAGVGAASNHLGCNVLVCAAHRVHQVGPCPSSRRCLATGAQTEICDENFGVVAWVIVE